MSYLVLGLSHRAAPLELLETVALDGIAAAALESKAVKSEHVAEALVVSTCNRTEIYAEVHTFHGALNDMLGALASETGHHPDELKEYLHVHYAERAVSHVFSVAAGLDSMAVGEAEILGQLRGSLDRGQRRGHVGSCLNILIQQALRVGKRVHSETGIDSANSSYVDAGLDLATDLLGDLGSLRLAVLGAGAMSAVTAATASRRGVGSLVIVNRSFERGARLAERVGADALPLADLDTALREADIVISCTGAPGRVVTEEAAIAAYRARSGRPQIYIDLAVPHDISRNIVDLDGVRLVTMAELGEQLAAAGAAPAVGIASDLVAAEALAFQATRNASAVGPTVAALRSRAGELVDTELARFDRRTPDLGVAEREEVRRTVHRVVEKLLHTPTVRVKQLTSETASEDYARALRDLFDLDPALMTTVSRPLVNAAFDVEVAR